LISAFQELTGIGALLNTSLNLHGDPMNRSAADAARTLALSALEFLSLPGDRLLYKASARSSLEEVLGR
jgi:carbamoyltransferase